MKYNLNAFKGSRIIIDYLLEKLTKLICTKCPPMSLPPHEDNLLMIGLQIFIKHADWSKLFLFLSTLLIDQQDFLLFTKPISHL